MGFQCEKWQILGSLPHDAGRTTPILALWPETARYGCAQKPWGLPSTLTMATPQSLPGLNDPCSLLGWRGWEGAVQGIQLGGLSPRDHSQAHPGIQGSRSLLHRPVGTKKGQAPREGCLEDRIFVPCDPSTFCAVKPCCWSSDLAERLPARDNILATSRGDRDTLVVRVAKLFTLSFMAFEGTWRSQSWEDGCSELPKVDPGATGPENAWADFSGT